MGVGVLALYLLGPEPHLEWSVVTPVVTPSEWQCPPGMSLRETPGAGPEGTPECRGDNTMALNESFRKPATRTRPVVLVAAVDHRHISMYLSALSIRLFDLDFTSGHHAGFGIGVRRPSGPAR